MLHHTTISASLVPLKEVNYSFLMFSDYKSFGYRGFDRGFHSEKGIVHVFESSPIRTDYLE